MEIICADKCEDRGHIITTIIENCYVLMLSEGGGNMSNGQDFQPITAHIGMFPEVHTCLA